MEAERGQTHIRCRTPMVLFGSKVWTQESSTRPNMPKPNTPQTSSGTARRIPISTAASKILPGLLRDVFPCQITKSDFALSEEEAGVDNVESFWMPREIGDLLAHHLGG
jgi:hypothetical protein